MGGLFPVKAARFILVVAIGMLSTCSHLQAETKVKVSGLGIFGNLDMQRRLTFLNGAYNMETYQMDPREVEDSAYIILQQLMREGHPSPAVEARVRFGDERELSHTWTMPFKSLSREDYQWGSIASVNFACEPGRLNYYRSVKVEGVDAIDEESILDFYLPSGVLFTRKVNLAFTEGNLQSRTGRLMGSLHNKGYMLAAVAERTIDIDKESGEVDVRLKINQGPLHKVGVITLEKSNGGELDSSANTNDRKGEIFNFAWLREFRQSLLNDHHANGFPDATLVVERQVEPADDGETVYVNLRYTLDRGRKIELAGIRFEPEDLLKNSVLRRSVDLGVDEPFDLLAVERARRNLLALNIFSDVDLEQVELDADSRIASYTMVPLPRQTLHLRFGWGSYERARAGLRWKQLNLWNRAHSYELDIAQSMKASKADLTYVIPHFFDEEITAYAKAEHEFREEISYERTTSTLLFGANRWFEKPNIELAAEYSVEIQDTDRGSEKTFSSTDKATVSSLTLRAIMDRRDSVLYPTSGYDASVSSKTAVEALGGNANFQKFEIAASYHKPLWNSLYTHFSIRYGGIFARSPTSDNLPFNERFFPGGEGTLRGYQQGQAAPVDDNGKLIGAEAYVLANVEIEQRLISSLSVLVFWDGLLQSVDLETVPDNEDLHSVGIGLRLRTPIGPVRLEYGHNLNPRPGDPEGTLHFAVGYPF